MSAKRLAEDLAERVSGVTEIHNQSGSRSGSEGRSSDIGRIAFLGVPAGEDSCTVRRLTGSAL